MAAQPSLCQNWSKSLKKVFAPNMAHQIYLLEQLYEISVENSEKIANSFVLILKTSAYNYQFPHICMLPTALVFFCCSCIQKQGKVAVWLNFIDGKIACRVHVHASQIISFQSF